MPPGKKTLEFILKATGSHRLLCSTRHLARLSWQHYGRRTQGLLRQYFGHMGAAVTNVEGPPWTDSNNISKIHSCFKTDSPFSFLQEGYSGHIKWKESDGGLSGVWGPSCEVGQREKKGGQGWAVLLYPSDPHGSWGVIRSFLLGGHAVLDPQSEFGWSLSPQNVPHEKSSHDDHERAGRPFSQTLGPSTKGPLEISNTS